MEGRVIRRLPAYSDPFLGAQDVYGLEARYLELNAERPITDAQCLAAGLALLQDIDLRANLRIVYHWKLESFVHRFSWVRSFPDVLSDRQIEQAVRAARQAVLGDERTVCVALQALDGFPHVGIPVASAILTAIHPDQFTVIDRQAYKTLKAEFRDPIQIREYLHYLNFCRSRSLSLGVSMRQYDRALWQAGSDASRSIARSRACLGMTR